MEQEISGLGAHHVELAASHPRIGKQALIRLLRPGETELEIGGPGAERVELAASHPRKGKQALLLSTETDCRGFPSIYGFPLSQSR